MGRKCNYPAELCMECKRHSKYAKEVYGEIVRTKTGRETCNKFIQR